MCPEWWNQATHELIKKILSKVDYLTLYETENGYCGEARRNGVRYTSGPQPDIGGVLGELLWKYEHYLGWEDEPERKKKRLSRRTSIGEKT